MLSAAEVRSFVLAENVQRAYHSRDRSENWGAWDLMYPDESRLLSEAMELWHH
jgi:hypothetical protein